MLADDRAVVLLSGGQDSTTCLYWAKERFKEVHALTFFYGQRHSTEIEAARTVAQLAGVSSHKIMQDTSLPQLVSSALLSQDDQTALTQTRAGTELPSTFVPGRNLLFTTIASAYAYEIGAKHVVLGVCETDYSGYPDCREHTLRALEEALRLGIWGELPTKPNRKHSFWLHAPLMYKTKAETVQMAREIEGCWDALAHTVTCYTGSRAGCGACPACELRRKGFQEAGEDDPARKIH